MSREDKVNRNNMVIAGGAGACDLHNYQLPKDKISTCKNCGMQIIILDSLPTPTKKGKARI